MTAVRYLTRDGDMLDWICWRHYGRSDRTVEAVLAANPGLAERGPVLPAGIELTLPDIPTPAPRRILRIWG